VSATTQPQDVGRRNRKPVTRATRKVEPIKVPPLAPSDWAENYVPTEADKARQREYEQKRAREIEWENTPADSPF